MARYFDVHPVDPQPRAIAQAVAILREGGLVAYPTDSCFALGCSLDNPEGKERILRIRQLDDKTLVSGQISAEQVAELKQQGVTMIVNNRPEGEEAGQPTGAEIEQAAEDAGTTVTLDMEDHTTTDSTLSILAELRRDFPETGAVLQSYLHRTESDCRDLATAGSRVRLCKGVYKEPASVAYQDAEDVDLSYVRCLKVLMAGEGYPMVASHDPRLIDIARALASRQGREPDSYEFQMLYGIRPDEQTRIADRGHQMRVYVPFGEEWYGYLMRRMAERPANLTFFLRSLVSRG